MDQASARIVERVVGALLCLAAAGKAILIFGGRTEPFGAGWALAAAIVEAAIGLTLVSRLAPTIAVPAGALLFSTLAGVSLVASLRGVASCGCFGDVAVPPWVTLAFDLAAGAALFAIRRRSDGSSTRRHDLMFVACLSCFTLGRAFGSSFYAGTAESTKDAAAAAVVVLDADRLRGQAFPFLGEIRIEADLSRGARKLVLARPGCRKCEQRLRDGECEPGEGERVAIILDGDDESWAPPPTCRATIGRLSTAKRWAFASPLVVRLVDGKVVEVW